MENCMSNIEDIPLFHSTIPFHHSSPVIVDYPPPPPPPPPMLFTHEKKLINLSQPKMEECV